jgi:hypothetical protein
MSRIELLATASESDAVLTRRYLTPEHHKANELLGAWMACANMDVYVDAVETHGLPVRYLPSGAGHDAMAMADLTRAAMLFVRCAGGISHNPAESVTAEDAAVSSEVLLSFIRRFSPAS